MLQGGPGMANFWRTLTAKTMLELRSSRREVPSVCEELANALTFKGPAPRRGARRPESARVAMGHAIRAADAQRSGTGARGRARRQLTNQGKDKAAQLYQRRVRLTRDNNSLLHDLLEQEIHIMFLCKQVTARQLSRLPLCLKTVCSAQIRLAETIKRIEVDAPGSKKRLPATAQTLIFSMATFRDEGMRDPIAGAFDEEIWRMPLASAVIPRRDAPRSRRRGPRAAIKNKRSRLCRCRLNSRSTALGGCSSPAI